MGILDKVTGWFGSKKRSEEELRLMRSIGADPRNIKLKRQYADWLLKRKDIWGKVLSLYLDARELENDEPEKADAIENQAYGLMIDNAARYMRPLKALGLEPRLGSMYVPFLWIHDGLVDEVEVNKEGVLPEQAATFFDAAPCVNHLKINGSRYPKPDWKPKLAEIVNLPQMTQIHSLEVTMSYVTDELVAAIGQSPYLKNLTRLALEYFDQTCSSFKLIANSSALVNLESLDLSSANLTDEIVNQLVLSKLKKLRELNLKYNDLTIESIKAIGKSNNLSHLQNLNLNWNSIGDEGAKCLAAPNSGFKLVEFAASQCEIGEEGFVALIQSDVSAALQQLEIMENNIGNLGMRALVQSSCNRTLQKLDVGYNGFDSSAIEQMSQQGSWGQLQELVLTGNSIGDEGANELAKCDFPKLTSLQIDKCDIGDNGLVKLLKSKWIGNIEYLHVGENNLGDVGAKIICDSNNLVKINRLYFSINHKISNEWVDQLNDRFGDSIHIGYSSADS